MIPFPIPFLSIQRPKGSNPCLDTKEDRSRLSNENDKLLHQLYRLRTIEGALETLKIRETKLS